jgi:hypothetical protein
MLALVGYARRLLIAASQPARRHQNLLARLCQGMSNWTLKPGGQEQLDPQMQRRIAGSAGSHTLNAVVRPFTN